MKPYSLAKRVEIEPGDEGGHMNRLSRWVTFLTLALAVPVVITLVHLQGAEGPIVATQAGRVQGVSGAVLAFKGI
jgi:hypothetical protein